MEFDELQPLIGTDLPLRSAIPNGPRGLIRAALWVADPDAIAEVTSAVSDPTAISFEQLATPAN